MFNTTCQLQSAVNNLSIMIILEGAICLLLMHVGAMTHFSLEV